AADAHGDDHVFHAAALPLDQGVPDHAGARHAIGMADGDRAAVDVQALIGNAELVAAVDHLHGEGLIQLPEADIVHLQAETLQQLRHGIDRADPHLVGLAAGDRHAAIDAERLQAALLG